ncbi:class I SAM-dependent methyltransferase [Reyranella sp.]|jgi:SAM-dependent methyltransferase|uniref:class I SAM-dependent methyltransferase n=1 Tax=Reyranella sp. TaxID=1929291 RepID=UPI002F939CDF
MDAGTFAVEARIEATHWWFVGRRRLFAREIARAGVPATARVLDVGTSTGTNLRMLRDLGFAEVEGLDLSEQAIRYCAEKGLGPVRRGDICAMPFAGSSFDLVLATDVIEHVEDDALALRETARVLEPGGAAIVTVPAFQTLYGLQDRVARHRRRYLKRDLAAKIRAAGLELRDIYYFNYLLFLPIWLARRLMDLFGARFESEAELNSPVLNWILGRVFAMDVLSARLLSPPFGVSLFAIARKPA